MGKPESEKMLPTRLGRDRLYMKDPNTKDADFIQKFYKEELGIFGDIVIDEDREEFKMLLHRIGRREDKRNISGISIFECDKIVVEFSDGSHFETYLLPF